MAFLNSIKRAFGIPTDDIDDNDDIYTPVLYTVIEGAALSLFAQELAFLFVAFGFELFSLGPETVKLDLELAAVSVHGFERIAACDFCYACHIFLE